MLTILLLTSISSGVPGQMAEPALPPVRLGTPDGSPSVPRSVTPAQAAKPDPVLAWNRIALQAIRRDRSTPLRASRNLAILHAAIFDAVNSVHSTYQAYRFQIQAPGNALAEVAAAVAAHRVLAGLYPKDLERFNAVLDRCLDIIPESPAKQVGIQVGLEVAEKMLAWRSTDSAYKPTGPISLERALGRWVPTPPEFRAPLLPGWSRVPCFCMKSSNQFRPVSPPALSSQEFLEAFTEVKSLGGTFSSIRTPDQTEIAWFWADGEGTSTPPGHWNQIAQDVSVSQGLTLEENSRFFALLNLAMADAAIHCWECKYHFDYWRPVTAIRQADRLGNPAIRSDPDWTPLVPTPPFPSYTSGHSSFSGAASAVLASFFGNDLIPFSSRSDQLPGVVRRFTSFSSAAEEAGKSRIYGGIHYEFDNREGLKAGRSLGEYVAGNYLLPVQPRREGQRGIALKPRLP